ncbi:hypothetical protein [Bacillus toyonensis]|nr:hypothetical protein [Bacillus toyonensis]
MKKLVLATLGVTIALSFSNNTGNTQHALKKEEIIQYSHADHF